MPSPMASGRVPLLVLGALWVLCAPACCAPGPSSTTFLQQLPWQVRDHLLMLQPHLNISTLTGSPVPLHRPDLGEQVAYWLVPYNNEEYAIVSAGQHTGDSMLVMQGEGPSPLIPLQQQAQTLHQSSCTRYLLLTPSPDITLACATPQGQRVTNTPVREDLNLTSLWEEMKAKRRHDYGELDSDPRAIHLEVISASEPSSFPVTGMSDHHIRPMGQSNGSDISVAMLCKLLGVCDKHGRVHVHRKTDYGEVYVHLEPVHENQLPRFQHDLHFEVVGNHKDHGVVIKRFAIEPYHRAKRQSAYTYYSIDDRNLMPNYNQFPRGRCQVGCGPVAWAQVFGYYDRRAHLGTSGTYASRNLYKCGTDGTTGTNTCVAPSSNDNRMEKYIGEMNDIMGTFCLAGQGATTQRRMDDVEGFFRARQGSSGDVILKSRRTALGRLIAPYSDSIRDDGLSYIRQKWPVIVGFRVSGIFSQHYAVMTRYRTRTRRVRKCFLGICRTNTVRDYDMYVHMGWGGSQNGWRTAEMFMALVAKY